VTVNAIAPTASTRMTEDLPAMEQFAAGSDVARNYLDFSGLAGQR
jgi:hypothetical protein